MSDSFYEVISSCMRLSDMPGGIVEWIFSFFSKELGKSISSGTYSRILLIKLPILFGPINFITD